MASNSKDESAVVVYARKFYELLEQHSELNEYDERVYEGKLTDLYKELGASSTYYSRIRKILVGSGSVEFTQRGTRTQPSIVKLNGPPPPEDDLAAQDLTAGRNLATLTAEVEARVSALESWRETQGGINIVEALRNFEKRISRLEALTQTNKTGEADNE